MILFLALIILISLSCSDPYEEPIKDNYTQELLNITLDSLNEQKMLQNKVK